MLTTIASTAKEDEMTLHRRIVAIVLLVFVLTIGRMTAIPALAASCTHYVAMTGSDANPGTLAAPWQTIQKAANSVTPGSTVCIRGGVYSEVVTVNVSGSAGGGFITFQSYPGEQAVLDGTNL